MSHDEHTRPAPPAADLTRSLADHDTTVARPDPVPGATPSSVQVIGGPDPSATVVNPDYRAATAPPADDPPLPAFDHFQPQGEVGRGGMGVVYRALDTRFMRDVAVKVLSERLVHNRSAVRRFLEEARLTAQLTHTAIPPVHHIGTLSDGRPYLAMKLIKGRTLGERLRDRADPLADLPEWLGILEQVCLGVGYAHSRGVIHRDLKPGNIMVGAFGEVQVMDWGLAKEVNGPTAGSGDDTTFAVGDEPGVSVDGATKESASPRTVLRDVRFADEEYTRAGTILGTPAYMSPEQAGGEVDKVNARSDVFSLGAMLCVILTGQPPYTAKDTMTAVRKALDWETGDAFRRLAQCKADPGVIDLCKRCLAKDPANRPADGEAVAKELAGLKAAAAERLRRADLVAMAGIAKRQEEKRRRGIQLGLGSAVLAIVAMFGVAAWYLWDQDQKAKLAAVNEQLKEAERAAEAKRDEDARAAVEAEKRAKEAKLAEAKRVTQATAVLAAHQQTTAALNAAYASTDDDAWELALDRVRAAHSLTEGRLADAPEPGLVEIVTTQAANVAVATKYRKLVGALNAVAFAFLEREQVSDRNPAFADRYRTAFREAGYADADPPKFSEQVVNSPSPVALLIEAVFDWHHHAAAADRQAVAALLDRVTEHDPFLAKWWAAGKDATPAGTKALLALAAGDALATAGPWVLHRVFCDLWHRGEREEAIRVMRDATVRHPSDYRLHARFALHLGVLNTPAARGEAIAHATAAIALRPKSMNAYILLSRATAEQSGNPADALRYLDRVIALDRNSLPARVERAAVFARMNMFKQAEDEYAAINRIDPTVETRLAAVRARWANGERGGATADLTTGLLPTVPKTAAAQLALARTCRAMYLPAEAEAAYRAAVVVAPKQLVSRIEFARYLSDQGQTADRVKKLREAETVLTTAAADFPLDFLPQFWLVVVYEQLGERAKALAAGEAAANVGKGISDAEFILGVGQLYAQRYVDATATAERFVKTYPLDWRGPDLQAQIATAQGKRADAIRHYEQAIKLNPTAAHLWNNLGARYANQLDTRKAVRAFEEAVRLDPNNALYQLNLGGNLMMLSVTTMKKGAEH